MGFHLGQRLGVQASVLADVEGRKMKSKSAHLAQKRINHQLGPAAARDLPPVFSESSEGRFRILWQRGMTLPVPALRGYDATERL